MKDLTVNERERILMEQVSMYADPKYSRRAAQVTTISSLYSPMAAKPDPLYVTKVIQGQLIEEETHDSIICGQAWNDLVSRLGRNPTKWELINECRAYAGLYDVQSATFVRDTAGYKPVDESKLQQDITVSPLRQYTDEELKRIIEEEQHESDKNNTLVSDNNIICPSTSDAEQK